MSSKSIFNICLKVIGVYYALSSLNMLPSSIGQTILFWNTMNHNNQNDSLGMMVNIKSASIVSMVIPTLLFLFSLLIIFKSQNISNYLLEKDEPLAIEHSDSLSITVLNFCIKMFGFFAILSSIPYLADLLSIYWVMRENLKFYDDPSKIKYASSAISAVLYIIIGLVLILNSSMLANRLLKIDSGRAGLTDKTET